MQFILRVIGPNDCVSVLHLDAQSRADARRQASDRGYSVLSVLRPRSGVFTFSFSRGDFPLLLFTRQLIALTDAGTSMLEALETLARKEPKPSAQAVIRALAQSIATGKPISQALEAFPDSFPRLFIETVRAGERTGDVIRGLMRFVAYRSQVDSVKKRLVTASIYPCLVVLVGLLVVGFLVGYVVPRFSQIYGEIGRELPWTARVLMDVGGLVNQHGRELSVILIGLAVVALVTFQRPATRSWLWRQACRLPSLGERLRAYELSRFYRTLGMLLESGTAFVPALEQAKGLLGQAVQSPVADAVRQIREGQSVSAALQRNGLTTAVAIQLLQVGERSGTMAPLMEHIANFHDEELSGWIERVVRLFEPLLMLAIGVVIGLVVVLMYLPIFELAGSLQ